MNKIETCFKQIMPFTHFIFGAKDILNGLWVADNTVCQYNKMLKQRLERNEEDKIHIGGENVILEAVQFNLAGESSTRVV